ncbi:MAG: HAMP domain-containing sensor histidine kinase [Verrucomicrobiota bacterium]
MNLKTSVPFALLVLIPLGLLAVLAWEMSLKEQTQTAERFESLIEQQLNEIDATFRSELLRIEQQLLQAYQRAAATLEPSAIATPLVRHAFLLDADSRLLYPAPDTRNPASLEFLDHTQAIWASGLRFGEEETARPSPPPNELEEDLLAPLAPERSQAPAFGLKQARQRSLPRARVSTQETGWHAFFHGSDIGLLHWVRLDNGQTLGAEINRAAFLARLIGDLPSRLGGKASLPDTRIVLRSATREILHQWGAHRPEASQVPLLSLILSPPLESWTLDYYSATIPAPRTGLPLSVLLNLAALALVLLLLAWWFYRENNRALREASQRVSFVNQVSHELKTPLTNIRLYTEMAAEDLDGGPAHPAAQSLHIVQEESSRLSRLIQNVLSFARADRQKLQLHPQPLNPNTCIQQTLAHWQPTLDAAGITVETDLQSTQTASADPDALEQILGNLLSNIEKYAAQGGRAHIASHDVNGSIEIHIQDQGPGIPQHAREKIFTPFTRLSDQLTEGVSGTGIGLSIARTLAQEMNATLALRESSKGAHFVLTLPLPDSPLIQKTAKRSEQSA